MSEIWRRRPDSGVGSPAGARHSAAAQHSQHRRVAGALARAAGGVAKSAIVDRMTQSQARSPMSADDVVTRNLSVLVARAREAAQDNDYARAYLRIVRQNVVGPVGFRFRPVVTDPGGAMDWQANDALEAAWLAWGRRENCTVTGRASFRAAERAVITSAARDGEFFVRCIYGQDAGPWGFALQIIDPVRIPVHLSENHLPGGRFVRHGIEFNQFGRALFYLVAVGDRDVADGQLHGLRYVRVPAEDMIHGYFEDLTGQKRGLPWMSTALWRLNMTAGFEDAALVNARASAAKGGFFEWDEGYGPAVDQEDLEKEDPTFIIAEPGTYQELTPGLRFKSNNPGYPSGEFAAFLKAMLRGASAGLGTAYNAFANDLEGVNFSSIRSGTLEEREYWKELQDWLVEAFHAEVYRRWLSHALLSGRVVTETGSALPAAKREKFRAVEWHGRRWAWIDPLKDVQASIASRNGLLMSTGQIIREQGRDPWAVYKEIAEDLTLMRDAGIPEALVDQIATGRLGGGVPRAPVGTAPPPAPAAPADDDGGEDGDE